jgi:hypothetical protein
MAEDVFLCGCGGFLKQSHVDDVGTVWFKCDVCGRSESLAEIERNRQKSLEALKIEHAKLTKPLTVDGVVEILGSTVKYDDENKAITFLVMLLTFTDEDQTNLGFLAESSTGKSYIPLELSWYFPKEDVIKLGYASPTAFFHEYGIPLPDPNDRRDVEDQKKRKIIHVDLRQKILIFLDQPHDQLLQRLRSLLSHDERDIILKITDKRERHGLRTKTVVIEGYPTVIFCTAKFSMADQEKTRLLLLSPEVNQEKLREAIALKIERESDREGFCKRMMEDPQRKFLASRIEFIKTAHIKYVKIPEELREKINRQFLEDHKYLIARHQRDVSRLLAIIKGHALLNYMHRERIADSIVVNLEDVEAGFKLYYAVSEANELGLSPEIYNVFKRIKNDITKDGITINDFQKLYYNEFHKPLGSKRSTEILDILSATGLLIEKADPNDKRVKRFHLSEIYSPALGGNKPIPPTEGEYSLDSTIQTLSPGVQKIASIYETAPTVENDVNADLGTVQLQDLKAVYWSDQFYDLHPCCICGYTKQTSWKAETFKGNELWICEDCKQEWEKRRNNVD